MPKADTIRKEVNALFDLARKRLGNDIIRPLVAVSETIQPGALIHPIAFDNEMRELCRFLSDFMLLNDTAENHPALQTRVRTLLYCHIFEADFPYLVILNLLRMLAGLDPSWVFYRRITEDKIKRKDGNPEIIEKPSQKIENLITLEKGLKTKIGVLLKSLWNSTLRNAFIHSQYSIETNGAFVATKHLTGASGTPLNVENTKKLLYLTAEQIRLLFDATMAYFDAFFKGYMSAIEPFRNGAVYTFDNTTNIQFKDRQWTFTMR